MNIDRLDWDSLRVFRVVAELGSMTAAATSLGESTPTVSRKLDELERVLGTSLLVRSTRGVQLTSMGEVVLRHACVMENTTEALREDIGAQAQTAEGVIRLTMGDGLGAYWVAPRVPAFHALHPKLRLMLTITDTAPDLHMGEADIAIQFNEPLRSDLITRRLGVLHYMGFATEEYLKGRSRPKTLFELHEHQCVMHTAYVQQVERWAPKTADMKQMMDFALITNSSAALVRACLAGAGIAILPSYAAIEEPRLVPLDIGELAPIQFWLTYTERVRRLPTGQAVIDWLKHIFNPRDNPWFKETFVHPRETSPKSFEIKERQ